MSTNTEIATVATTTSGIAERLARHARHARGALAAATERALKGDVAAFSGWCAEHGLEALPAAAATVVGYIDAMAEHHKPATIRRRVSSIATFHRAAGLDSPTTAIEVKLALKRMARANGTRQRQARPINYADRCRMIDAAGANLAGARDAALLGAAYDSLARRSELVALDVADFTVNDDGTGAMLIRRSKTDQAGEGQVRFLAADTVALLKRWIEAAGIADGPLFRSVRKGSNIGGTLDAGDVARIFKRLATRAGIPADGISGHSTRIGAAQDLTAAGFGLPEIMVSGGWRSGEMVGRYTEHLAARRGAMARLAAQQERV